jgi:hypothetical protein
MAVPNQRTTFEKMRRLTIAALAALVLPAAALSGANPHAERLRLTPAGEKLAKRALLRRTDLPDWTSVPTPPDNGNLTCPGFDPDVSAYTVNGRARASYVHSALAQIGSTADVFASRAHAVGDFKAGAKPQLAGCLRYLMDKAFRSSGGAIKASVLSARKVRAPRLGERSAAYQLVSRVRVSHLSLRAYTDLLVIQRGRTIAALIFTGIDQPVPAQAYYGRIVAARMR